MVIQKASLQTQKRLNMEKVLNKMIMHITGHWLKGSQKERNKVQKGRGRWEGRQRGREGDSLFSASGV